MDLGLLEKLVRLMHANDLTCVEVADGERRILLKRGGETVAMPAVPTAKVAPAAAPTADAEESNLIPIKSAMVGTFYAAASPDAAPFVRVGSAVEEETDVCVIEAMKVFNTVKAECKGTIARILVTNGQAVEFGQALFLVKGT
jgi:acetyl-CoA carboxylase biotin carboxyl carrier protein